MRNSRFRKTWAALLLASAAWISPAAGFSLAVDDSGVYVVKWQSSPISMQVRLAAYATNIDGTNQSSTVVAAMQTWNAQLGVVQFSWATPGPGTYASGNGVSEIVLDSTTGGRAFPKGTLALTLSYRRASNATAESDIVFNSAYTWDSYRGALRQNTEDMRRVAIHELGHVLGLQHPDEKGQTVTAIMNSHESGIDTLQTDDISGAQKLYGRPGVTPLNDDFAHATPFALTDNAIEVGGSNIAATREGGEPLHATSSSAHSVWWKWTAVANGHLAVSTLGSDFDTVLSVYTGSNVGTLAEVASNDDEESIEEHDTPDRKRTSKVTFDAVKGTTYFIAVDGWGSDRTVSTGYFGTVALGAEFTIVVPPAITTQPLGATVSAGRDVEFAAGFSGHPLPEVKWQRRAAGADEWVDIVEDATYQTSLDSERTWPTYLPKAPSNPFEDTAHLFVHTVYAMRGDQFRCVATNPAGTAYSDAAVLNMPEIPLPVVTVQPRGARLLEGVSGRLRVEATDAKTYQWYRNEAPIVGETKPLLYLPNPQMADAGDYYVALTNTGGTTKSQTVTVTIGRPAVITNTSPTRQLVSLGGLLSFSATATGTGTLKYQWYHDGRPVSGATATTLARPLANPADAGAYWLAVTDDEGTRHGPPFFAILSRSRTNVVAWGSNYSGQAEVPAGLVDALAISAGGYHAVALRADGTVVSWGSGPTIPASFTNIVATAAGGFGTWGLKADGTVVAADTSAVPPAGLKEVWAIAAGREFALALKTDGTVESWGFQPPQVNGLENVVAISGGLVLTRDGLVSKLEWNGAWPYLDSSDGEIVAVAGGTLALAADGSVARISAPPEARDLVSIVEGRQRLGLRADGRVVSLEKYDLTAVPAGLGAVFAIASGGHASFAIRDISTEQPLLITVQPQDAWVFSGQGRNVSFFVGAAGGGLASPVVRWQQNGRFVENGTAAKLTLFDVGPSATGVYTALIDDGGTAVLTDPVIMTLLLTSSDKLVGSASQVGSGIRHPNGNTFDQILLNGAAASFRTDFSDKRVSRCSFLDMDGDIVQVELSGPGTLSIVLDASSDPAVPEKYNQNVKYAKGHAGIVIAGANGWTNVSIFTVGRATAYDPTGAYDILQAPGPNNDPVRNGSSLFAGHEATHYDGIADLAFIVIKSTDGTFGGVRASNANFFASRGLTGLYAPYVAFQGPVYVGDISAFDSASAVLVTGAATDVRITGGSLLQGNGQPVRVNGFSQLNFTGGSDSNGNALPVQKNQGVLQQDGEDVTAKIVNGP